MEIDDAVRERYRREHPRVRPSVAGLLDCTEPSIHSSTLMLQEWFEHLSARLAQFPDNSDIPVFLGYVEMAVMWRETVPLSFRFWRTDASTTNEIECWRNLSPAEFSWWI